MPPRCRLLTVVRDKALVAPEQTTLAAGDVVAILAPATSVPMLALLFHRPWAGAGLGQGIAMISSCPGRPCCGMWRRFAVRGS
ncbi:TrkA C-terminal domain-containing protein [Cupriavidus basilensis]